MRARVPGGPVKYTFTIYTSMPTRGPYNHYDSPQKNRFVGRVLAQGGEDIKHAAEAEGINGRTGYDIWKKFDVTKQTHRRPGSGRPRIFTKAKKARAMLEIRRNRRRPLDEVGAIVGVSASTVRAYLRSKGYRRCRVRRVNFLTAKNKVERLEWAKLFARHHQWDNIIYSDESYFYIDTKKDAGFVTRRPDEKYEEDCCIPTFKQANIRVMVWGCIAKGRKGPLVILDYPGGKGGGMDADRYREEVLEGPFLPFYQEMRKELRRKVWFQQDGAPAHRAKLTRAWFNSRKIPLFPHPANSPDMSPIEPIWHILKHRLRALPRLPTTQEGLKKTIKKLWDELTVEEIDHYIAQMPERVRALLKANGVHTKY